MFLLSSYSVSVVIGAPKANTSQFNITEGGSVYFCPWSLGQSECHSIEFDNQGKTQYDLIALGLDHAFSLLQSEHVLNYIDLSTHKWFKH